MSQMISDRGVSNRLDPVERAVEHRPHQLGHAGIEDHERASVRPILDVDDPRQERARGSDDVASGLEDDGQAGVRGRPAAAPQRIPALTAPVTRRTTPKPAAEIQVIDDDPVVAQFARECHDRLGRPAERIEVGDLRSDVDVEADDLERLAPRERRQISRAASSAMPNLLVLSPVEICGWLRRVDVRVDPERDSGARLPLPREASIRSSSPSDSALIVLTPRSIACASSAAVLPTPVKTICSG